MFMKVIFPDIPALYDIGNFTSPAAKGLVKEYCKIPHSQTTFQSNIFELISIIQACI